MTSLRIDQYRLTTATGERLTVKVTEDPAIATGRMLNLIDAQGRHVTQFCPFLGTPSGDDHEAMIRRLVPTLRHLEWCAKLTPDASGPRRAETDPHGLAPHTPGAKLDSGKVRVDLVFDGMASALWAVAEVASHGVQKYSEHGWQSVPHGFQRYTAAMDRHRLAERRERLDPDSQLSHAAHLAWNALARLERLIQDAGESDTELKG